MEHRYSQRTHTSAKLLIYKKGIPVALGLARNISRYGIFVQTDYADISPHELLEVEFLSNQKDCGAERFKTIVVHTVEFGFGLEIDEQHTALSKSA